MIKKINLLKVQGIKTPPSSRHKYYHAYAPQAVEALENKLNEIIEVLNEKEK